MNISKNNAVSLSFELRDEDGEMIDSSKENGAMVYLHGHAHIPSRLEQELENKKVGDEFEVKLSPEEGYGEFEDGLVQSVKKTEIEGVGELTPGLQFPAETDNGMMYFTVVEVEEDTVVLDGNHPLAGEVLHFKIKVDEVREATKEELDHGHVHGPGGHAH